MIWQALWEQAAGLYQWKEHGRGSGLSATEYYTVALKTYTTVMRPGIFRKMKANITLPASVVEAKLLEANPKLSQNQITITCQAHKTQEVRICLSKDMKLVKCGYDVAQDCTLRDAEMGRMRYPAL
jgi:ribonuclease T2